MIADRRPQLTLIVFVVAFAVVHAMVGFWTPIQADDWDHWLWAGRHADDSTGTWIVSWLGSHFTFSDAISYVLARSRMFHVLVTPAVMIALIVGLFTVSMRRLPRATWQDVFALVLASMLVWLGQPSAGVTFFHTPNVALFVYGSAVMVWFMAPLRCNWQPPRAFWPVLAIAGYCVGSSTRAIATAMLVYFILELRKRRARWMWVAFGGLVVGTIAGYINPPWIEFARVVRRGFEQNLIGPGLLKFIIEETGEVISLVVAFVLANLALGMLGRGRAPAEGAPDSAETLRWMGAWFATAIWCLFGPKYHQAMLLPATCMLVVGALPYLMWLAQSRILRYVLVAFALVVHGAAWTIALTRYHLHGAEAAARMHAIETARPGDVVKVAPYWPVPEDSWFVGEDLDFARLRQLLALDVFGLRDIDIDPPFRRFDPNPQIEVALETDNLSDADLRAARAPTMWATDVAAARKQFELFVKRLREQGRPVSARLVVKNIELAERGTRPLLVAWADAAGTMIPRVSRSPVDPNGEYTVKIYPPDSHQLKEGYVIEDGIATSIPYRNGGLRSRPMTVQLASFIGCNKDRCLLADAFIPRF